MLISFLPKEEEEEIDEVIKNSKGFYLSTLSSHTIIHLMFKELRELPIVCYKDSN